MSGEVKKFKLYPNRRRFLKTAASFSGLLLSGCGWTLGEVRPTPTPSKNSDILYIYSFSTYLDRKLLRRFTAETGIKVVADVYDSNETMLAKMQAGGGRAYSVLYPSDYMVRQMLELGMLTKLDRNRIEAWEILSPQFQNPAYDPNNSYSVPIAWGTTGLIYNSKKLKQAPEDWAYLWENQQLLYRRITLVNDVREVMGATLRMLGYSYNSTNAEELQQAYQKLKDIKSAIASFTTDAWREQLLAGDLLLAMGYSADAVNVAKENPDLQYLIPKSGTSVWTDTMAIPKTAPNPDAAYAWINFMLKPEVAAFVCERLNFPTVNQEALKLMSAKTRDNPTLYPPPELLQNCERIEPLGKFSEVFDRYWTQLTSS
ncbi:ABC transporter substrate-binding protein [Aerosakkonema funiforme]|uniref:Spermidine/putrescine ABC transporter substrate-binding protein n=1 Tax=Aerosakkonema funiforme FACHB-1375 TaxID=2949571 RepID=A0A926VDC3_9CYAN|nr:spermidine/putrescine ABC transporter substrate-binding protein [Aerosakkonema funiforme]MBD2181786.1 spermidine/putrescine ABC transporter substrate-binding protein [Aerosakkonema funiforme FACHB-1375]